MGLFFFRMSILPAGLKGGGEVGDVDERILPPHIRLRQPWHCQTPPIIPPVARIYRMAAQQCFVNRAGKRDGFDPVLLMEDGRKRKRFGLRWDESVF
jgi:hypothetical protein